MHNFVVDVDRRAVSLQRQFHDVHSAHDTGAKTPGPHTEQDFPIFGALHGHLVELPPRTLSYLSGLPERIRFAARSLARRRTAIEEGVAVEQRLGLLPTIPGSAANICRKSAKASRFQVNFTAPAQLLRISPARLTAASYATREF